jgi:hypothetical protein
LSKIYGEKLKYIGGYFGTGESGVSQANGQLRINYEPTKKLKERFQRLKKF